MTNYCTLCALALSIWIRRDGVRNFLLLLTPALNARYVHSDVILIHKCPTIKLEFIGIFYGHFVNRNYGYFERMIRNID